MFVNLWSESQGFTCLRLPNNRERETVSALRIIEINQQLIFLVTEGIQLAVRLIVNSLLCFIIEIKKYRKIECYDEL